MRRILWLGLVMLVAGCKSDRVGTKASPRSSPEQRASRRAYDGAPPVIPHENLGAACTSCHNEQGVRVEGLGYAPPSPHARTNGLSDRARCRQCHVFRTTNETFRVSTFEPLAQNLRKGTRLYGGAPPVIPHDVLMRENCASCHTGPAARAPIRTSHPDRVRCQQCHAQRQRAPAPFTRSVEYPK